MTNIWWKGALSGSPERAAAHPGEDRCRGQVWAQVPALLLGGAKVISAPSAAPGEEGGDCVPSWQKVWMPPGTHPSPRALASWIHSFPYRNKKKTLKTSQLHMSYCELIFAQTLQSGYEYLIVLSGQILPGQTVKNDFAQGRKWGGGMAWNEEREAFATGDQL